MYGLVMSLARGCLWHPISDDFIMWQKRDSIHHHLQEVTCETATVLEWRQKLLYTTPSGWWWRCIKSFFRSCLLLLSLSCSSSGSSSISSSQSDKGRYHDKWDPEPTEAAELLADIDDRAWRTGRRDESTSKTDLMGQTG